MPNMLQVEINCSVVADFRKHSVVLLLRRDVIVTGHGRLGISQHGGWDFAHEVAHPLVACSNIRFAYIGPSTTSLPSSSKHWRVSSTTPVSYSASPVYPSSSL